MRFAFWRRPRPEPRPNPDAELRRAQSQVDQITFIATEHARVTEDIAARTRENHVSQAIDTWIHQHPKRQPNHRRMPWSHA